MRRTALMLYIYPIDKFYIGRHKSSKKSHEIPIRHGLLDGSIFLDVLHFQMKNIKSRDLKTTPMGGATSKPASDVVFYSC